MKKGARRRRRRREECVCVCEREREREKKKEEKVWIVNVVPQYSKAVHITSNPLSYNYLGVPSCTT